MATPRLPALSRRQLIALWAGTAAFCATAWFDFPQAFSYIDPFDGKMHGGQPDYPPYLMHLAIIAIVTIGAVLSFGPRPESA